ncbi:MAG: phosphoglycerate kinase [Candidatus Bathyarchaeota archaeon]|nr:MAG: phosphoglycerate kinase [Candidatus Bathyarchaeota archaeon]
MPDFLTIDDFNFKDKTTLIRVDFNSPIDPETNRILDDTRIRVHGETIRELAEKGAKVVILAHQGRPGEPDFIPLKQHAELLGRVLSKPVKYVNDIFGETAQRAIKKLESGEILVLDNVRGFVNERKKGTPQEHSKQDLVQKLAPLADVFVNDAFAAAHRAHVSVIGFTAVFPSIAGRVMERELKALTKVLEMPEKPCVFILGGAKADDSLDISRYVLMNNIADHVLTGGVIGHVFLVARGFSLGKPNMEYLEKKGQMGLVPGIEELMKRYPGEIEVPADVAVEIDGRRKEVAAGEFPTEHPIYDIGTETIKKYAEIIGQAKSIVLSGPMGVFEKGEFVKGTKEVFNAAAASKAFSLVGGGHTVAAVEELGVAKAISYVSTAGGALIEFLMGKQLPGVIALKKAAGV